jgi:hypothetical protein
MSPENKQAVHKLLLRYHASFAKSDRDLGKTDLTKHKINTGDSLPIKQIPRRIPVHMQKEVDVHVNGRLQQNIIESSNSQWASNIVLVKKEFEVKLSVTRIGESR